jgi:hypothetical protein
MQSRKAGLDNTSTSLSARRYPPAWLKARPALLSGQRSPTFDIFSKFLLLVDAIYYLTCEIWLMTAC